MTSDYFNKIISFNKHHSVTIPETNVIRIPTRTIR